MKTSQKLFAGLALAGALVLSACSGSPAEPGTDEYPGGSYAGDKTGCLVNDKQAIGRSGEDGNTTDYRVFTDNCGTFAVQDDPFIGQWNSGDTYGKIKVGSTYDFEAYGWRNGFFSTFPNIKQAFPAEVAEESK